MNKKYLTFEGLCLYHNKLIEYMEARFGDLTNEIAEATVDLETGKIIYTKPQQEEQVDKYYYPIPFSLFEEEEEEEGENKYD